MELRRYIEILLKRRVVFLLTALGIVGLLMGFTLSTQLIYKSTAKVAVKLNDIQSQFASDLPPSISKLEYLDSDNGIGTIEEQIKSSITIDRVIKKLNILSSGGVPYEATSFANPNLYKLWKNKIGLKIEQIEDTEVFELTGYSVDPKQSVRIANESAYAFLESYFEINQQEGIVAEKMLSEYEKKYYDDLQEASKKVLDYMKANDIIDITTQKDQLFTRLSTFTTNLDQARFNMKITATALSATEKALKNQPEFKLNATSIQSNPLIESYKNQLYTLQMEQIKLLSQYTENHPEAKTAQKKISDTQALLRNEIQKVFSSDQNTRNSYYDSLVQKYSDTEIEFIINKSRERAYNEMISAMNKELGRFPELAIGLQRLQSRVDVLSDKYKLILTQIEKARTVKTFNIANARILEEAKISYDQHLNNHKHFPKKWLMLFVSIFLGLVTGVSAAFVVEYYDDSFFSPADVAMVLNRNVIGVIPRRKK